MDRAARYARDRRAAERESAPPVPHVHWNGIPVRPQPASNDSGEPRRD